MAIERTDPSPAALLRLGLKHRAPLAKLVLGAVVLLAGYALVANWFTFQHQ